MEFIKDYWVVFLIALIIGAIVGYLVFRPRQRVSLSDNTPVRPHMTLAREGRGLTDEAGTEVEIRRPSRGGRPDGMPLQQVPRERLAGYSTGPSATPAVALLRMLRAPT